MTQRCIKENQFKTTQKATEFNIKFNEDIHLRLSHYSNHINRFILEETDKILLNIVSHVKSKIKKLPF